jgi:hypothetical protein
MPRLWWYGYVVGLVIGSFGGIVVTRFWTGC